MNPLISVIVPVYNVERYLERCINSIINQTFRNIEIIIIDDGSFDNSPRICDEYADKGNSVKIIHQKNSGVSSARNCGLDNCNGQYICFVDSDDYLELDALEKSFSYMHRYDVDIVIFGYYTNSNNEMIEKSNLIEGCYSKDNFINNFKLFGNNVYYNSLFNKLYKAEIVKKHCISFENDLQMGEDLLFNLNYFKHCVSFYVLNMNLYNYNLDNSDSLMHKYFDNFYQIQKKLMLEVTLFMENNGLEELNKEYLFRYLLFNLYYTVNHYLKADIPKQQKIVKVKETLKQNANVELLKGLPKISMNYYLLQFSFRLNSYRLYLLANKIAPYENTVKSFVKKLFLR